MILTIRFENNPKVTFWNVLKGSEKFMSINNYVLKKASVAKLYSDIRRYFAKQQEIGLFYLIVESRIMQFYFCQRRYQYLMHVCYIPTVHCKCHESLLKSLSQNQMLVLIIYERPEFSDSILRSNNHTLSHYLRW